MIHGAGFAEVTAEAQDMQNSDQEKSSGSLERQESVATTEARLRMEGVELKEEWQDEDFPRPLPEDDQIEGDFIAVSGRGSHAVPNPLEVNGNGKTRKKLSAPNISLTLDRSDGSILTEDLEESGELDLDDMDTPSENSNEFEWEDDLPKPKTTEVLRKDSIPEYTATEEKEDVRRWRLFRIGDQDHRVDMTAIEPYKKVISHGGYYGDGLNAIIVFAVCFMPDSGQPNYRYLMENIFKYVIGTLEMLVAENYMIVYLNGATTRRKMPSLSWLRKCYQQIDRRLRKNLKSLIIVHPSWFIRTLLAVTKPFISSKFTQKIKYVFSLVELAELIPMEYVSIPECIKQCGWTSMPGATGYKRCCGCCSAIPRGMGTGGACCARGTTIRYTTACPAGLCRYGPFRSVSTPCVDKELNGKQEDRSSGQ